MTIYIAGCDSEARKAQAEISARLVTYADARTAAGEAALLRWVGWARARPGRRLFVDSGAFGVHTGRATVDLGAYCEFLQGCREAVTAYAALDVIGDAEASARNTAEMRRRGLDPVPTFHMGGRYAELERLLDSSQYVALGGFLISSARGLLHTEDALRPHLDACFAVIGRYWPRRIHLFGLSQQWILERYPAYSADSTSPTRGAGMGVVQRTRADGTRAWVHWREELRDLYDGAVADGVGSAPRSARTVKNLRTARALERYATDLWSARGVSWS